MSREAFSSGSNGQTRSEATSFSQHAARTTDASSSTQVPNDLAAIAKERKLRDDLLWKRRLDARRKYTPGTYPPDFLGRLSTLSKAYSERRDQLEEAAQRLAPPPPPFRDISIDDEKPQKKQTETPASAGDIQDGQTGTVTETGRESLRLQSSHDPEALPPEDPYKIARENLARYTEGLSTNSKEFKALCTYLQFIISKSNIQRLEEIEHMPPFEPTVIFARQRDKVDSATAFMQSPTRIMTPTRKKYEIGQAIAQLAGQEYLEARHAQVATQPQETSLPPEKQLILDRLEAARTALHDLHTMFGITPEVATEKAPEHQFPEVVKMVAKYIYDHGRHSPAVQGMLEQFTSTEASALRRKYELLNEDPSKRRDYVDAMRRDSKVHYANTRFSNDMQKDESYIDGYYTFAPSVLDALSGNASLPENATDLEIAEREITDARTSIAILNLLLNSQQ